jgi:hypothetical protein
MMRGPQTNASSDERVNAVRKAALEVLVSNAEGGTNHLPRTAGFGYPEPYTRDLMIASLGVLQSGNRTLVESTARVLDALAKNQSPQGHIPALADEPDDRGESDTTPLFLIGLAAYRRATGDTGFLEHAADKALAWLSYQSPGDRVIVAQQPTSDWRDEQWVQGYGLYVNTLVYGALRLFGERERAEYLRTEINRPVVSRGWMKPGEHEGLALKDAPYFALWSYKVHSSSRFDLLGNSLAILTGIAPRKKATDIIDWIEEQCALMRARGSLAMNLPPNLLPFIEERDPDWRDRYDRYNRPGEYHNGGIWPFVCGFYVAALVAAGRRKLAAKRLSTLTDAVLLSSDKNLEVGFNEWIKAQDGRPRGVDWQTWSAAMYLFAADCVEKGETPLFDEIRGSSW